MRRGLSLGLWRHSMCQQVAPHKAPMRFPVLKAATAAAGVKVHSPGTATTRTALQQQQQRRLQVR